MKRAIRVDKPLALLIGLLVVGGAMIFASAAFGLLARGSINMSSVVFGHLVLGVGIGTLALLAFTFIDYKVWRRYSPYIFALALIATAAVFLPHIGMSHGGGRRWLILFGQSLQPSEGLKIAAILFAAGYFAAIKHKTASMRYGLLGLIGILALPATILVLQPDLGTLGVICFSVLAVFFAAGGSWRDIGIVIVIGILALGSLAAARPYVRDRIITFLYPAHGQQAESYQIKQSLIAIGSGGFAGRGFGQSVQKFTYLPEPMGDSIFAVAAEELGFAGASAIIILFLLLALRGYAVASQVSEPFGALLAVGISTYLVSEAFINIASMLGLAPLTGIPLTFISQGGSAMLASLASAGILLSVSRFRGKRA